MRAARRPRRMERHARLPNTPAAAPGDRRRQPRESRPQPSTYGCAAARVPNRAGNERTRTSSIDENKLEWNRNKVRIRRRE